MISRPEQLFSRLTHQARHIVEKFKAEAATLDKEPGGNDTPNLSKDGSSDSDCEIISVEEVVKKKKKKIGFRERRIIEYENRIRAYSSPDKIFRYFATLKVNYDDGTIDIFMTPTDFVRSLTPGVMQPRHYGLDKFKNFNPNETKIHYTGKDESIFYWMGSQGLINYSDYLFLMTLLSTPSSEFRLAFFRSRYRRWNFPQIQNFRDYQLLFGADGKEKLNIEKFLKFQQDLHRDILKIEAITPACQPDYQKAEEDDEEGISFHETNDFFAFLYHIDKVDMALHFYKLAGKPLTEDMIKKLARKITGVQLSNTVVDILIALFDENGDGQLSQKEFITIMKKRMQRGLERPKDTGLIRTLDAFYECGKKQLFGLAYS
uniref:EF-hand domain-containing protein n=1 Tax=Ditylenchus dipsaci TaxID=166011 RepID=A0A915EAL3_9BILA